MSDDSASYPLDSESNESIAQGDAELTLTALLQRRTSPTACVLPSSPRSLFNLILAIYLAAENATHARSSALEVSLVMPVWPTERTTAYIPGVSE
jgi:hypothetical protein